MSTIPKPTAAPSPAAVRGALPARAPRLPEPPPTTVIGQLLADATGFDFFQALRVFERAFPDAIPLGQDGPVTDEPVRIRTHISLNFPASSIYQIRSEGLAQPSMEVTFMGLAGCHGALPRSYTDLLMRMARESKHAERDALREWLDLFNHRLISLFYRAWTKYRFFVPYERREWEGEVPDPFTHGLLAFTGIGLPKLRNRIQIRRDEPPAADERTRTEPLAKISDLALLHYAGLFAQRPHTAANLEAIVADYFRVAVTVQQFQGEWLRLEPDVRSQVGLQPANCLLGQSVVIGERVWSVEGKIRLRIGPLPYRQFAEYLPDQSPTPQRKTFLLLCHLVRLYVGPTLTFDVQFVLRGSEIPGCRLTSDEALGPRLGWNTWIFNQPLGRDVEDAVFGSVERFTL